MGSAGAMDQPITLQAKTLTSDGAGGSTHVWGDMPEDANIWAKVTAKSGRENFEEGRTNATFVVLFEIYNRDDVTELDRIMWNGTPYNIRGIRREGNRELGLVIEAERGVSN